MAVKNLTTAGVILEILHLDNGFKPDSLRGQEGLFTMISQNDSITVRVPAKILWTRTRDGDSGITLGLELLEPLPLPVRHTLEANMAIGAKDMKVLWDYWDEIHESDSFDEIAEPVATATSEQDAAVALDYEADNHVKGNGIYWVGFGAIICGLGLQFPQSEYLGFSGLVVMFLGSLVVALKSLTSMRRVSSPGTSDWKFG